MNFFEQQAAARRGSGRLVLLFVLAVAAIVLTVDLVTLAFTGSWGMTGFATVATLAVIGLGSLYRIASLSGGGAVVAAQMGGTFVPEDTRDPSAMAALGNAETGLAGALSRLMVVSEAYPDLKANQNMMQLTEELTSTENRIAFARQASNDSVMAYNNRREVFPSNIIAGMFNFVAAALLEITDPAQRQAPKVSF